MTLAKAVEAARGALRLSYQVCDGCVMAPFVKPDIQKALASLPEPMTEDEVTLILDRFIYSRENIKSAIRALHEAGCLFVKDEK